MLGWFYRDTTCDQSGITETWKVAGRSKCDLGPSAVLASLVAASGVPNENNPALPAPILGLGIPYGGPGGTPRPCDLPNPNLFMRSKPTVGAIDRFIAPDRCEYCCRLVTLRFTPRTFDDPLDWCPTWDTNSIQRFRAKPNVRFKGAYQIPSSTDDPCCDEKVVNDLDLVAIDNECLTLVKDQCTPPVNSAGQQIVGFPEVEENDFVHRFSISHPCFPGSGSLITSVVRPYLNMVNCFPFRLCLPCRCREHSFAVETVMLRSLTVNPADRTWRNPLTDDDQTLRVNTCTFEFLERPRGFDVDLLNQGTESCVFPGAPDGQGGTFSAADIQPGQAPTVPIQTATGWVSEHPQNLNLDGIASSNGELWALRYATACCIAFADHVVTVGDDSTTLPGIPLLQDYLKDGA